MSKRSVARILIVIACFLIAAALILSVQFVFNTEPVQTPTIVPTTVPTTTPTLSPTVVTTPVPTSVVDNSQYYLGKHDFECDCCKAPYVSSFACSKQETQRLANGNYCVENHNPSENFVPFDGFGPGFQGF